MTECSMRPVDRFWAEFVWWSGSTGTACSMLREDHQGRQLPNALRLPGPPDDGLRCCSAHGVERERGRADPDAPQMLHGYR